MSEYVSSGSWDTKPVDDVSDENLPFQLPRFRRLSDIGTKVRSEISLGQACGAMDDEHWNVIVTIDKVRAQLGRTTPLTTSIIYEAFLAMGFRRVADPMY